MSLGSIVLSIYKLWKRVLLIGKKTYSIGFYIPDLPECPDCNWKPGKFSNGRVYCCCDDFAEEEWILVVIQKRFKKYLGTS